MIRRYSDGLIKSTRNASLAAALLGGPLSVVITQTMNNVVRLDSDDHPGKELSSAERIVYGAGPPVAVFSVIFAEEMWRLRRRTDR